MEVWKPAPGAEGFYEVSSLGRVRSLRCQHGLRPTPLVMKPSPNSHGYYRVKFRAMNECQKDRFVHQMVLEAFSGPRPEGMVARHLNGKQDDNSAANLAWGTQIENMADAVAHETMKKGVDHHFARLTEDQVREIRKSPRGPTDLAPDYNVSPTTISQIRRRKTWKHL